MRSNLSLVCKTRIPLESGSVWFLTTLKRTSTEKRQGLSESPTRDRMRTRGAVRAVQHPETPASVTSPRLTVDATHGRGSESIAGPQQDQHHPLQRTTARPSVSSASLNASPASPVDRDESRGARSSRTALNSHQLTPTQLAFVSQVEMRLDLKADEGSRTTGGTRVDILSPRVGSECRDSPVRVSSARPQPSRSRPRRAWHS